MTTADMTESEWNELIDEWYAEQQKEVGIVTVPGYGTYPLPFDPSYAGVTWQTHKVASEDLIRHYAFAIGDSNPLWQDPTYAKNSKYGCIIGPPTCECFIAATFTSRNFNPPGFGRLMSGVDHYYSGVIRAGDEFRIFDRTYECTEKTKPGSPYRLFLVRSERKYVNQRGEVPAVTYGGTIALGYPPGKGEHASEEAYKGIKRRRFSQEELDTVHRAYEEELTGKTRRGAEILYWEDVVEGEELKPVAAGPLDVTDAVSFFYGVYNTYAFALKWHEIQSLAAIWPVTRENIDPETGEAFNSVQVHLNDYYAKVEHSPYAVAFAAQTEGILAKLVCNWMGDNGLVKRLNCQSRNIWIQGHIVWAKGKVIKKYVENGEPLVDLELRAENQDGLLIMPATATVKLDSMEHRPDRFEAY